MKNKAGESVDGVLKPKAYARILTMIGDQLIKNEKIALIELIKNAYDADSDWVQIRFIDFENEDNTLKKTNNSIIEIEDQGEGMDFATLSTAWLNPASPNKYFLKENKRGITKKRRRVIQGEKGIGRFATLKIGNTIELFTRSITAPNEEIYLKSNFAQLDSEFVNVKKGETQNQQDPLFLDDLEYYYERRKIPEEIIEKPITILGSNKIRKPFGTKIKISNIKEDWSLDKIQEIVNDIRRMNFSFVSNENSNEDLICDVIVNGESLFNKNDRSIGDLFNRAPVRVKQGEYNAKERTFSFLMNEREITLSIDRLKGKKEFKKHFLNKDQEFVRYPECGSFHFEFYIFDLNASVNSKYYLEKDESAFIKSHRIYLYRDNIRVYPYGDTSDDWLGIDVLRGTGRAGDYLSNDQIVGYIGITRYGNPFLKDKTNREGLLEIGSYVEDFKALILGLLGTLKSEFDKYKNLSRKKSFFSIDSVSVIQESINELQKHLEKHHDAKSILILKEISKDYNTERKMLIDRIRLTEDLASVGISVESTSHDTLLMLNRIIDDVKYLQKFITDGNFIENEIAKRSVKKIREEIEFVHSVIFGIQPIFRSLQKAKKNNSVFDVIEKVRKYYNRVLEIKKITLSVSQKNGTLEVKCPEAILIQVFINLVDNSIYWLDTVDIPRKEILVTIDGNKREVLFSDNGPGVSKDDIGYIFEPFYSTKGLEGRGMGLYISRQLLGRSDYSIEYIQKQNSFALTGANFLISFSREGKK